MPNAEVSNAAMGEAAEQLLTIVEKGANLRDGHPGHLKLAIEIADLLVSDIKIIRPGAVLTAHSQRYSMPMA